MKKNNTIGFVVVVILLSAANFFSINLFMQERKSRDILDVRKFPYTIGEWKGKDIEITEREYKILETRNLISREYTNSSNEGIGLFIIYSETNRSVFHPPEACLMGGGIMIQDKSIDNIDSGGYKFTANKLYLSKNDIKEISLYSYKTDGLYTADYVLQQARFSLSQLFGRRVKGATLRVSMIITQKGQEYTLKTLRSFIVEAAKILDKMK
jgi:EpsI family protein